jgi:hypothetical protein
MDGALVIGFEPGPAFYDDYDRFYRRRSRGAPSVDANPDKREIGEPLKLAYLFAEKRTGQRVSSVAFVNSKDVNTAKQILAEITFKEAPAFLDFALAAARETNFDVQTLGGVRQYLARYKARKVAEALATRQKTTSDKSEAERLAYDGYRRRQAQTLFQSLPSREQQVIDEMAERAAARFNGSLRASMRGVYRAQITARRHPNDIKTLDQWRDAA